MEQSALPLTTLDNLPVVVEPSTDIEEVRGPLVSTSNEAVIRGAYNVYTNEERKNFAVLYLIHGNVKIVAGIMELPYKTLYGWLKSDWWPRFYDEAKRDYAELIEARLSDIVEKATSQLIERIEKGDEVMTKDGRIKRIKMTGRDLALVIQQGIDKIRLLQNKPTRMTAEVKFDASKLERNFAELADKYHDRIVSTQ